jgi:hypothetical protein
MAVDGKKSCSCNDDGEKRSWEKGELGRAADQAAAGRKPFLRGGRVTKQVLHKIKRSRSRPVQSRELGVRIDASRPGWRPSLLPLAEIR